MNYRLIILFQIIFQTIISHAQGQHNANNSNYKIVYKYSYQPDSTLSESSKTLFMQLDYADGKSQFQSLNKRKSDSLLMVDPSNTIFYSYGIINPTNYLIEKDADQIKTFESINGVGLSGNNQLYEYIEPRSTIDWILLDETDTIAGYHCQKSTANFGGRKWEAWFTQDIPLSDGPYKFCDLPGLILAVSDEHKFFNFTVVSIEKGNDAWVDPLKVRKDLKVTKGMIEEFFKERKKYRENMIEFAILQGNTLTEKQKEFIKSDIKKDNNHIEKY